MGKFLEMELRPWQKSCLRIAERYDDRGINLIYDRVGNIGKSIFCEYCEYIDIATEVPPYRLMDDIFAWVCSIPVAKTYIFDMPRGMKKDKLGDFYSGIEIIKNGVAYDKRYKARKIRFNRPNVFVFTNTLPALKLMSLDRWKLWEVTEQYELNSLVI